MHTALILERDSHKAAVGVLRPEEADNRPGGRAPDGWLDAALTPGVVGSDRCLSSRHYQQGVKQGEVKEHKAPDCRTLRRGHGIYHPHILHSRQ